MSRAKRELEGRSDRLWTWRHELGDPPRVVQYASQETPETPYYDSQNDWWVSELEASNQTCSACGTSYGYVHVDDANAFREETGAQRPVFTWDETGAWRIDVATKGCVGCNGVSGAVPYLTIPKGRGRDVYTIQLPSKHVFSPSQIDMYLACNRKWGFRYIDKVPDPGTKATELGTEYHGTCEHYLKTGEAKGQQVVLNWFAAAKPYMPEPKRRDITVEGHFAFAIDGVGFQGFIDFQHNEDGWRVINDHKTTTALRYIKTPQILQYDTQAIIYAFHAYRYFDKVLLCWLYTLKKGKPKAKPVAVHLTKDHVDLQMARILDTAKEMKHHRDNTPRALDLAPTPAACGDYGGCPYQDRCQLNLADRLDSIYKGRK